MISRKWLEERATVSAQPAVDGNAALLWKLVRSPWRMGEVCRSRYIRRSCAFGKTFFDFGGNAGIRTRGQLLAALEDRPEKWRMGSPLTCFAADAAERDAVPMEEAAKAASVETVRTHEDDLRGTTCPV